MFVYGFLLESRGDLHTIVGPWPAGWAGVAAHGGPAPYPYTCCLKPVICYNTYMVGLIIETFLGLIIGPTKQSTLSSGLVRPLQRPSQPPLR